MDVCEGDLTVGYLDDVTIGGDCQQLLAQIPIIEAASSRVGLQLNHAKCEFVGAGEIFREGVRNSGCGIPVVESKDSMLFGAPLTEEWLDQALQLRRGDLQRMTDRPPTDCPFKTNTANSQNKHTHTHTLERSVHKRHL